MKIWSFDDASNRLNEILDAAVSAPQTIEKDGRRFSISLVSSTSEIGVDFLLKGGPLDGEDDAKA